MAVLSYQEKENYWYIHLKLPFSCKLCFDPLTYYAENTEKTSFLMASILLSSVITTSSLQSQKFLFYDFTSQVCVLKVVYLSFSEPNGMKCWSMLTI